MKKHIEYSWRLREIMAARGLFNISDLIPPVSYTHLTLPTNREV